MFDFTDWRGLPWWIVWSKLSKRGMLRKKVKRLYSFYRGFLYSNNAWELKGQVHPTVSDLGLYALRFPQALASCYSFMCSSVRVTTQAQTYFVNILNKFSYSYLVSRGTSCKGCQSATGLFCNVIFCYQYYANLQTLSQILLRFLHFIGNFLPFAFFNQSIKMLCIIC